MMEVARGISIRTSPVNIFPSDTINRKTYQRKLASRPPTIQSEPCQLFLGVPSDLKKIFTQIYF